MDKALQALQKISRQDITELRTFSNPPKAIQDVLIAVNVLLGDKSDWESAKQSLMDFKYLERLKDIDFNLVTELMLSKLGELTSTQEFAPEMVGSKSMACKSLCHWVLDV